MTAKVISTAAGHLYIERDGKALISVPWRRHWWQFWRAKTRSAIINLESER